MHEKVLQKSIYSITPGASLLFISISGLMLLLVLMGFGNSLFLRPLSDSQPLPLTVLAHGVIMTVWYIGVFIQAILIKSQQFKIHLQMGWFIFGVGIIVIIWSGVVTLMFIPARIAAGADVESRILVFSSIVWGDIAALCSFILFFGLAIIKRTHSNLHIPLMIFASLSILEPALFRIWGWEIFSGVDRNLSSLYILLMFCLLLVAYEYVNTRRVQSITLFGIFVLLGFRVIALYIISDSDIGYSFIRSLY